MEIKSFGSICSGVGMQEMAYKRVFNDNIKYYAEIDKFAIKSYNAIHGDIKNLGDFTKAEDVEQVDFMFASTPCQDFSTSGRQDGFDGMRGTLTFEWVKMLKRLKKEGKLPKVIGFENVKGIIGKKFIEGFEIFKEELEKLGYELKQRKMNAKNYGVPQNRDRIFFVGFLEKTNFNFPGEFELKTTMKDYLEKADFKDYKCAYTDFFIENSYKQEARGNGFRFDPHVYRNCTIAKCITTRAGVRMDDNFLMDIESNNTRFKFALKNKNDLEYKGENIRKLTELECWRLMGISDNDFYKAEKVNDPTQLYKQAGNGIVVDVLEAIFQEIKKCKVIEKEEVKYKYDVLSTGEKQYRIF